jgi:hypothetical protein
MAQRSRASASSTWRPAAALRVGSNEPATKGVSGQERPTARQVVDAYGRSGFKEQGIPRWHVSARTDAVSTASRVSNCSGRVLPVVAA